MATEDEQHSRSQLLLAIVLLEFSIGTIIILLRTYTKFRLTKETEKWSYGWALLTWVTGLINCTAVSLSVSYGLGKHIQVIPKPDVTEAIKWSWVSDGTSRFGTAFGRTAVAAFIYGIQGQTAPRWRKILLWSVGVSNLVLNIFIVFILFFRCNPPAYVWDKTIPGGKCPLEMFNQYAAYVILAYGGATDLFFACYPISIISALHMPTRTKMTLSVLFSFGLAACVCAVMTTYELHTITTTEDPTYVLTPVTIWAVTEIWAIFIASSVPALYPLRRVFSSHRKGSAQSERPLVHGSQSSGSRSSYIRHSTLNEGKAEAQQISVSREFEVQSVERSSSDIEGYPKSALSG